MRKIYLGLFTLLFSSNIIAQTTAIPDANFEQALITLGYDSGFPDGQVLTANINTITYLDVNNLNISSLSGIEDFTALTVLKFRQNQVSSLDVTQHINLIHLECDFNQLLALDVTQNPLLNFLSLQSNQVPSIDVSQNTLLTVFWCTVNQLTSIDVSQNLLLYHFNCGGNQLTSIDVSMLDSLKYFNCELNQLTNIDITNNLKLERFGCWSNLLTNIDVSYNTALTILECMSNQLTELNISANPNIVFLKTEMNNLTCLNAKNGNNTNFTTFWAQSNPNLLCIEVDNTLWANTNWTVGGGNIDSAASFSTNCNDNCSPIPCNASANYSYVDNGNGNYSFTNTSVGNYDESHWAFGDGNTLTTSNPNYTFSANGTFVVVLTINNSTIGATCFDCYIDTIVVTGVPSPAQCTAGFVMYPDTATGDITVVNSSTGTNLTYTWDFGDATPTSPLANPSHTYSTPGVFYLCLTVNDGAGCIDMYCDSIGENGVVFKQAGFTINVIAAPIITGINNTIKVNSEINIYPNPTSNQLTIISELKLNKINIINVTGQQVKTITTQLNTINVIDLPSGIYFIELIAEKKTIIRKFVKE